jgi:hypothetical protein
MRDIRGDLQERASICEEQIRAAVAHFEQKIQQLQGELDGRVGELRSVLATVDKLMEFENRFEGNLVTLDNPAPRFSLADRVQAIGSS